MTGRRVVVGLLADPGPPAELARALARRLPARLERRLAPRTDWQVETLECAFTAGHEDGSALFDVAERQRVDQGWDVAICLTDLPLRVDDGPLVADVAASGRVALVSIPALGGLRLRHRARGAVVRIIGQLTGHEDEAADLLPEPTGPLASTTPSTPAVARRVVATGARGRLRLIAGMLRANQPWRLVPSLSGALVGALATSAIATVNSTVWLVSDSLSAQRLAAITVLTLVAMVVWLIVDANLWETSAGATDRHKRRLYNTATVLTLSAGVLCCYVALLVVNMGAAALVLPVAPMESILTHPVDAGDYFRLAVFVTAAATVGGALGSGFDSDEAVRRAAYGRRERARREFAAEQQAKREAGDHSAGGGAEVTAAQHEGMARESRSVGLIGLAIVVAVGGSDRSRVSWCIASVAVRRQAVASGRRPLNRLRRVVYDDVTFRPLGRVSLCQRMMRRSLPNVRVPPSGLTRGRRRFHHGAATSTVGMTLESWESECSRTLERQQQSLRYRIRTRCWRLSGRPSSARTGRAAFSTGTGPRGTCTATPRRKCRVGR